MCKSKNSKFKKGAASFYIIAFSTLILLVIVTSFAAIIISEVTRTANDDLSQSAYDSALAGVEDAKLALSNYQNCLKSGASGNLTNDNGLDCGDIIYYMEEQPDCDMVGHILGRIEMGKSNEVVIDEDSEGGNNMAQAYTCVKIDTSLSDYKATLTSANPMKVIRPKFEEGVSASQIEYVTVRWYSDEDSKDNGLVFNHFDCEKVTFPSSNEGLAMPPTISVALVQTAGGFTLDDFQRTEEGKTDRGMIYLVPSNIDNPYSPDETYETYENAYYGQVDNQADNHITSEQLVKSNDRTATNKPYVVRCDSGSSYACSATIQLPDPIKGDRNNETFMIAVQLPYQAPDTDIEVKFYCGKDQPCGQSADGEGDSGSYKVAKLRGMQVAIDSTGRANDLYRRVEARLDLEDNSYLSIMGPIELFGDGTGDNVVLKKNLTVTSEYGLE